MCPSAPFSPTTEDIGLCWPGELLVMCLERMICGDPIPANVNTEINPYLDLPWLLNVMCTDSIWYLHSWDLKASETGYWMEAEEECEIHTDSPTIGSRSTLQFFSGQAPDGEKTNWMMHAYRIQQKRLLEINKEGNSSSLCRVFTKRGQSPSNKEEQHGSGGCDGIDNNALLNSTELDPNLKHPTIKCQVRELPCVSAILELLWKVISKNEKHDPTKVSDRQPIPANSIHDNEIYDFSMGDYLELEDLNDPLESSFSSSENSICSTLASSEHFDYFDSSALLRDMDNDLDTQRNHTDNISGLLRPVNAAVRGDSSGAEQQLLDTEALEDARNRQTAGDRDVNELTNSSQDEVASSSSSNSNGSVRAAASPTSSENKDDVAGRRRSRSRIAKLRKKYLCFISC
ncbi:hypothetical protein C5167_038460 [Papaver somniferum]|uniref:NAC domain-containing protein n=1 Tax=Papaver somniferum TaxID=3469 RepID=A0A4Y7I9A8_PAPSO|nr:hypothetical protein C5167_038460 [Papaver somniferum]